MRLTFCQRHKLDARDKRRVTRRYFPSGVTERKTTRRSRLEQTMTAQRREVCSPPSWSATFIACYMASCRTPTALPKMASPSHDAPATWKLTAGLGASLDAHQRVTRH